MHPISALRPMATILPALLPISSILLSLLLSSTLTPHLAHAQTVGPGEACDTGASRLEAGTFAFYDECGGKKFFCNDTSKTCDRKGCRRDVFPFGYDISDNLPDICKRGEFCPDEGSECVPVLPVGSPCQLNRDDQCEPPPNFDELRDTTDRGLNVNGSVCIKNVCMWANVTAGQTCILENTAYIAYEPNGDEFIDIVSRGNCHIGNYCDAQSLKCNPVKKQGEACSADKECETYNCDEKGVCGKDPATPDKVAMYVYIIVAVCIVVGMLGTLVGLFFIHRKERDQEREKRAQYWREQHAFRQNILQMQESARHSVMGGGGGGHQTGSARSTMYSRDDGGSEDSQLPLASNGSKPAGSGLRHAAYSDDGASDDGHIMHESRNRF